MVPRGAMWASRPTGISRRSPRRPGRTHQIDCRSLAHVVGTRICSRGDLRSPAQNDLNVLPYLGESAEIQLHTGGRSQIAPTANRARCECAVVRQFDCPAPRGRMISAPTLVRHGFALHRQSHDPAPCGRLFLPLSQKVRRIYHFLVVDVDFLWTAYYIM